MAKSKEHCCLSINCSAVLCIHNSKKKCDVVGEIDVDKNGKCIDYSPVTDEEYNLITGRKRKLG